MLEVLGQDSLNNLIDLCYDCNEFQSTNKEDYPRHQMKKHPGRSGYPGLADIKEMGFKTQGKALGDLTTKMPTFSCEYCCTSFNIDYPGHAQIRSNRKEDILSDSITSRTKCQNVKKIISCIGLNRRVYSVAYRGGTARLGRSKSTTDLLQEI